MMRNAMFSTCLIVFGLVNLSGGLVSIAADEGEEKITMDQLPKTVVDAVKKMFPKADMTGATKEEEERDGDDEEDETKEAKGDENDDDDEKPEILYEVTLNDNGHEIDVTIEESGEIEEVERTIDLKDLPKLVTDALAKRFPKSTMKSAEAVYEVEDGEEELDCYEVKLETADRKVIEVEVEVEIEIEVHEE